MSRQQFLKIVNLLLGCVFAIQAISGFLSSVIPYEIFRPLHFFGGIGLVLLVFTHLILNFSWIKNSFMPKKK